MEGFENPKIQTDPRMRQWQQIVDRIGDFEKDKNTEDIEFILDADKRTAEVIRTYGLSSQLLAPELVHVIKQDVWPGGQAFFSREHGLFVCEDPDPEYYKMKLIHEMFHYKGVNFLPTPLTEAIVEKLTCQAINLDDRTLKGEAIFNGIYTYNDFRLLLDEMLTRTSQASVHDKLSAFSHFAKAHLSGKIENISFLDEIFGQGTVDRLNAIDDNPESLREFVHSL